MVGLVLVSRLSFLLLSDERTVVWLDGFLELMHRWIDCSA